MQGASGFIIAGFEQLDYHHYSLQRSEILFTRLVSDLYSLLQLITEPIRCTVQNSANLFEAG